MSERANTIVADAICAAFRCHGVTHAFGQSIPVPFLLAAPRWGIKQVAYRAENAGGAMADGCARISGKVGVVTAQYGPITSRVPKSRRSRPMSEVLSSRSRSPSVDRLVRRFHDADFAPLEAFVLERPRAPKHRPARRRPSAPAS